MKTEKISEWISHGFGPVDMFDEHQLLSHASCAVG